MLNLPVMMAEGDLMGHVLPHASLFGISNLQWMAIFSAVLVFIVFRFVAARVKPTGEGVEAHVTQGRFAQLFETMCVFVREEIARPSLGKLTDRYIYYIWTVFFFVLFCNVIGMIPFGALLETIARLFDSKDPVHFSHVFGGTATSTLTLNVPLALMSFVAIVFIGVRENGKGFFAHFAPVPLWPIMKGSQAAMLPISLMLVFLEILGLLIKCVVLAMRLFGTMLAGHLVLAALLGLILAAKINLGTGGGLGVGIGVVLAGTALSLLELFICMLQAFIFTFLTVLFISSGAVHHDEHEDHGPGHDEAAGDPAHDLEEAALVAAVEGH